MAITNFEVPEALREQVYSAVEKVRDTGDLRKGANEATKAIERNEAKLVVIAEDVNPPEVIMHLPPMCQEKDIPYVSIPSREELGIAAGLSVATAAIAIRDVGSAERDVNDIAKQVAELQKNETDES